MGRPKKLTNAFEVERIVNQFFEDCKRTGEVPSITGLADELDCDKCNLLEYKNCTHQYKDDVEKAELEAISLSLKKAYRKVERGYEKALYEKGKTTGAIFTLKNNFNWVDKQEIVSTNDTKVDITKYSKEELQSLLNDTK